MYVLNQDDFYPFLSRSESAALTGGQKVRSDRIYQTSSLQKQLFSQFNRCATKHPHAECCHHYILSCGRYMFRAPRLPHSNSAQEPFCSVLVLCPLENFVLILTQFVPYQYYSWHLGSGLRLRLQSLIFIFLYSKEGNITLLCLFFRIYSPRNQPELQIVEQPGKQSFKMKEFSIILQQLLRFPFNKCRITI